MKFLKKIILFLLFSENISILGVMNFLGKKQTSKQGAIFMPDFFQNGDIYVRC